MSRVDNISLETTRMVADCAPSGGNAAAASSSGVSKVGNRSGLDAAEATTGVVVSTAGLFGTVCPVVENVRPQVVKRPLHVDP